MQQTLTFRYIITLSTSNNNSHELLEELSNKTCDSIPFSMKHCLLEELR